MIKISIRNENSEDKDQRTDEWSQNGNQKLTP